MLLKYPFSFVCSKSLKEKLDGNAVLDFIIEHSLSMLNQIDSDVIDESTVPSGQYITTHTSSNGVEVAVVTFFKEMTTVAFLASELEKLNI